MRVQECAERCGCVGSAVRRIQIPRVAFGDCLSEPFCQRRGVTLGIEVTPKSHHQRLIPIGPRLRAMLSAAETKKASPWAPVALTSLGKPWGEFGLNQAFGRALERAGLSNWSFHDLRHFFVTELFRNGAGAAAIQQLAGHADLATTQRYADLDANDLRSAIARIDGNGVEMALNDDSNKP